MGDFGADTLRDSIETGWGFTGTERISKTVSASMTEIVHFFAHPQITPTYTKAVEVRKINTPERENVITHPMFFEKVDNFEITCRYRLIGGDESLFDQAEEDIEDMCEEVERIVKTVYDPSQANGVYFTSSRRWGNDDLLTGQQGEMQMELARTLYLQLSFLDARKSTSYKGYEMILAVDDSGTTADTKRGSDYTYTEAYNVTMQEGYRQIPELTVDTTNGIGVPLFFRGSFSGRFTFEIWAKEADLNTANIDSLDNIYKTQTNGESAEVALIHVVKDTGSTPSAVTATTVVRINSIEKISDVEQLVKWRLVGDIIKPTTWLVA